MDSHSVFYKLDYMKQDKYKKKIPLELLNDALIQRFTSAQNVCSLWKLLSFIQCVW